MGLTNGRIECATLETDEDLDLFIGLAIALNDCMECFFHNLTFQLLQLFYQPPINHQHQTIKISFRESIENHLFSEIKERSFIISAWREYYTEPNIFLVKFV